MANGMNHPAHDEQRRDADRPNRVLMPRILMREQAVTSLDAGHSDRVDGAAVQDGRTTDMGRP